MKKPGRPKKKKSEVKSERISLRSTVKIKQMIIDDFGSVQEFFDTCIMNEYLK